MRTLLYRNPRLLVVLLLLIVVAGFTAYTVLPRMEDPHYANRYAVIVTRLHTHRQKSPRPACAGPAPS